MWRRLRYLWSAKHLVGSTLGLMGLVIGVILHLLGLLGPFWWAPAVVLYGLGALVAPGPRPAELRSVAYRPDEIRRALDRAYASTHGRLPVDVQSRVAEIRRKILALVPHLDEFPPGSQDRFVVQRMANDYLPGALDAYLALPLEAAGRELPDGRSPLRALREQLDLLDAGLDEITEAVYQRDSDRLLAHGRFLEERFGGGGLRLPAGR
ncbi:MAG TPA: hypothetical protein VFD01_06365 [Candidatus Dormibacteraeota bacterium]|nr:hypothetical protein [Candidatus Dormibacteraeota bacterium]